MKNKLLFILLFTAHFTFPQSESSYDFTDLNTVMRNKNVYVKKKEKSIALLKNTLSSDLTLNQEYKCNENLYKEYRKFKLDSAIYYVKKNLQIASLLNSKELGDMAKVQLANLYSSSGKFRESEQLLSGLDRKTLSAKVIPSYYEFYSQFFEHYNTGSYIENVDKYRDSLLSVLDPNTPKYKIYLAQKYLHQNNVAQAQNILVNFLNENKDENSDKAMVAYLLGYVYSIQKRPDLQMKYLIISTIADIRNSIKDNASMQNMALIYYQNGDIDNAYKCTKSAIEDAIFCNVKFRTLEMSELYTIINTAYLDKEAKRKEQLKFYLILISILSLFLIIAVVYVYKQMRKVSRIKEKLHVASQKLEELNKDITNTNNQLHETNSHLSDANHVKEEYIAHFFDLCSTYINKLESYRKSLNKKATQKEHEELFRMLKSTTVVDNELEELYKTFDTIFLNLYPTFIKDFNALLIKDEQVVPKQGELLNTELRIFALVRLGITDSVKIAAFLRYSLSTIYNYRTKARNKAAVSRDEFEEMVSRIGIISGKST